MASKLIVLLSLAMLGCALAAPATPKEDAVETTTAADEVVLVEEIALEEVPVVVAIVDTTTPSEPEAKETTKLPEHKVAKRSALRGDNPSNDLLANLDGLEFENGLSGLDGRRIKFLPTWLG